MNNYLVKNCTLIYLFVDSNLRLPNELNDPAAQEFHKPNNAPANANENEVPEDFPAADAKPFNLDPAHADDTGVIQADEVYEALIKAEEEKIIPGLGDFGEAVTDMPFLPRHEVARIMKKEAFNKLLSDRISLTRKLPDARNAM